MKNTTQSKKTIIDSYKLHDKDTGSCEVQIALLTERIQYLTEHLQLHRKDVHTRRGLIGLASRRRKLLNYLKKTSLERYEAIVERLKLRY